MLFSSISTSALLIYNYLGPCFNATPITDTSRSVYYNGSVVLCDSQLTNSWYRFAGGPSSQMLAEEVDGSNKCGTHAPGWLTVNHPTGSCQSDIILHM